MQKTYTVEGMKCDGCKENVIKLLSQVAGVDEVKVDLKTKKVTVSGTATKKELSQALEGSNYHFKRGLFG